MVGVKGFFAADGSLRSVGIQCALCHSTVDDSFAPGIGQRLDGWANRDLNVGAIVALSPNLKPVADLLHADVATVKTVLAAWGPGKFDAELFLDGKAFRPDGKTAATLIPPAFGLAGVNLHTWTGWGSVTYWNAFVANLEMHGQGTFYDPRLDDATQFPIAAENRLRPRHGAGRPDHVQAPGAAVLPARAGRAEGAARQSFDAVARRARQAPLHGPGGTARAATCRRLFTEPGLEHAPRRARSASTTSRRTARRPTCTGPAPLAGLWTPPEGRLLPRRPVRRRSTRWCEHYDTHLPPRAHRSQQKRPRRVPEVAVGARESQEGRR